MNELDLIKKLLDSYKIDGEFPRLKLARKHYKIREETFLKKLDKNMVRPYQRILESQAKVIEILIEDALIYGFKYGRHNSLMRKIDE